MRNFYRCLILNALIASAVSCAEDDVTNQVQLPEIEDTEEPAPRLSLNEECSIKGIPAPSGSCEAPDGLINIGGFNPKQPSIIFAHGWIPEYEMGVPDFPNAEGWQNAGFNTFIFRFLNKASDSGEGAVCVVGGEWFSIFETVEFDCPKDAEARVWAQNGSGSDLVNAYRSFFDQYPNYQAEIRLVGHGLGAQLTTYLSFLLHRDNYPGPKPQRLELIDPYIGTAIGDAGKLPAEPDYPVPPIADRSGSSCKWFNNESIYCVMENSLALLDDKYDVGIAIYGSVSAGMFASDLKKFFHYQSFSANWLCSQFLLSNRPACTVRNLSVLNAQHFFPLLSYFWSIDEVMPRGGYSARTPTITFRGSAKFLKQSDAGNYCNLENGYKLWEEGGLAHVFGATRYSDSGMNNGYQLTTWSQIEFKRRMQSQLGFSSSTARQCASAISWENDFFYSVLP